MSMNYTGFVYLQYNLINGKSYIGSHFGTLEDGYFAGGVLINKARKKYGKDNFVRVVLEYYNGTCRRELYKIESFYIKNLKCDKKSNYYNMSDVCSGRRTLISRLKQSESMKGKKQSKETVLKRANKVSGVNHPSFKGYYKTPFGLFINSMQAQKVTGRSYKEFLNKCKDPKFKSEGWDFILKENIDVKSREQVCSTSWR